MSLHNVYIGLGSNLENPPQQIKTALTSIQGLPGTILINSSSLYKSSPVGPQDQPDFYNAACLISTELSPIALLDELQAIEQLQQRKRLQHWGPRTLDLDILLFAQQHINDTRLTVPHAELQNRDFVLKPLLELTPGLSLPCNKKLSELLAQCPDNQLQYVSTL